MRGLVPLLTVGLLLAWATVQSRPHVAQEQPAEPISKERPFLKDYPEFTAARALIRKACDGDSDAEAEIRASGLTYYGTLVNASGAKDIDVPRDIAFWLARKHKDWITEMCLWEYTLLRPDADAAMSEFKRLKPRFMNAESQLARVMVHARNLGDGPAYEAAAALAPESRWVKMVRAYYCDGIEPKEAIDCLLGMADEAVSLELASLPLYHSQMRDGKRPYYWSEEGIQADFAEAEKPASIRRLEHIPAEFLSTALFERIGALATEISDKEYSAELVARAKKLLEGKPLAHDRLELISMVAGMEVGLADNVTPARWIAQSRQCTASQLAGYAALALKSTQIEERIGCGIVALMMQPDVNLNQRFCLTQSMLSFDDRLGLLAVRAVIALAGNRLSAWRNVARALLRSGKHANRLELFRKALLELKLPEFNELAGVIEKGKWEDLNARTRASVALSHAQKAALLAPFVDEAELSIHGGLTAVYWLNNAVFLDGCRRVTASAAAYFECLKATPAAKDQPWHPNFFEFAQFLRNNCDKKAAETCLGKLKLFDAKTSERAEKCLADFERSNSGHVLSAAMRAQFKERVKLNNSQTEELTGRADLYGGAGLAAASASAAVEKKFTERNKLRARAEEASPLSYVVHYLQSPYSDFPGTSSVANWELVSRVCLRCMMLRPFSLKSAGLMLSLQMSAGQFASATISSLAACSRRQPERLDTSAAPALLTFVPFNGRVTWRALHAALVYSADGAVDSLPVKPLREAMYQSFFGAGTFERIHWQIACGENTQFGRSAFDEVLGRRNMSDVNDVLNVAYSCARVVPKDSLALVEKADKLGVSRYGRFVGTQAFVMSHGILGTLDEALKRYHDMRADKRTGVPYYLDVFMLSGVLYGNNYKQLPDAMAAIEKYELNLESHAFAFEWRRALMASGRHADFAKSPMPNAPESADYIDAVAYTELFHEAPALLAAQDYESILERCEPYLRFEVENGMGAFVDAAILHAVALKAAGKDTRFDAAKNSVAVVPSEFAEFLDASPHMLDGAMAEILCGRKPLDSLPGMDQPVYWHGTFYAERTAGFKGCGRANHAIMIARDSFFRGVLDWLAGKNKPAREKLKACVEANQRCSHEYHVAQWLLAGPLKE